MDGLLVIDKPAGPTSHDVVARVRRAVRERRIGHTGTLDPMATGVLPLVLGRATRLARFISAGDKAYLAVLRLGVRTDSGDAEGARIGEPWTGPLPRAEAIDTALDAFRGRFLQQPPRFSAKRIAGRRSYALARSTRNHNATPPSGPAPEPVEVEVRRLGLVSVEGDRVTLEIECSAGFYVRALADDLGERLGAGAHLVELRRTRHGDLGVADAMPLEEAERDPALAAARLIPLQRLLPTLGAVTLTADGVKSAAHGQNLTPAAWTHVSPGPDAAACPVRLLSPTGELVGLAARTDAAGVLHPFVVLM